MGRIRAKVSRYAMESIQQCIAHPADNELAGTIEESPGESSPEQFVDRGSPGVGETGIAPRPHIASGCPAS